jgi:hypothetical protein
MTVLPLGLLWPADAAELLRTLWLRSEAVAFTHEDAKRLVLLEQAARREGFPRPEVRLQLETLRAASKLHAAQGAKAREVLTHLLGTGAIETVFLAAATGRCFKMAPAIWYSASAPLAWAGKPVQWLIGEEPPLWAGTVLVPQAALRDCAARWHDAQAPQSDKTPTPEPGETKTAFVLRFVGLRELRSISQAEAEHAAKSWLTAKRLPCEEADIRAEGRRMVSLIRGACRKSQGS